MRVGYGYDIHRLEAARKLVLGGVPIAHDKGFLGHSDGDALLHAVCDALLGAAALGDIGRLFSDQRHFRRDLFARNNLEQRNRRIIDPTDHDWRWQELHEHLLRRIVCARLFERA